MEIVGEVGHSINTASHLSSYPTIEGRFVSLISYPPSNFPMMGHIRRQKE
jgi:hypothetical protein